MRYDTYKYVDRYLYSYQDCTIYSIKYVVNSFEHLRTCSLYVCVLYEIHLRVINVAEVVCKKHCTLFIRYMSRYLHLVMVPRKAHEVHRR